jgi:hypothetical protein
LIILSAYEKNGDKSESAIMAKVRSPNYPLVDLTSALVLARKLYDNDGRNKVSKQALASHLGHDTLSGPALGKIGALRAYGLVEGNGDENRISEDAITALMAPNGSADQTDALRRLALQPSLFREIHKEFPTPPSDSNLRYWLVKRGFSPDGAAKAAKTYLGTIALVTIADRDYRRRSSPYPEDEAMQAHEPSSPIPPRRRVFPEDSTEPLPEPATRKEVVTLDEGDVVITFPANLSAASFTDLEDHLRLFIRKMQRRISSAVSVDEDSAPTGSAPADDGIFG